MEEVTNRFSQGFLLQTITQNIKDQNKGMNSKVTELADNVGLSGIVKRRELITKYIGSAFVALSD